MLFLAQLATTQSTPFLVLSLLWTTSTVAPVLTPPTSFLLVT